MNRRRLVAAGRMGLSAVALGQDSAKFAGTWKSKAKVSGFEQIMTIANDDARYDGAARPVREQSAGSVKTW